MSAMVLDGVWVWFGDRKENLVTSGDEERVKEQEQEEEKRLERREKKKPDRLFSPFLPARFFFPPRAHGPARGAVRGTKVKERGIKLHSSKKAIFLKLAQGRFSGVSSFKFRFCDHNGSKSLISRACRWRWRRRKAHVCVCVRVLAELRAACPFSLGAGMHRRLRDSSAERSKLRRVWTRSGSPAGRLCSSEAEEQTPDQLYLSVSEAEAREEKGCPPLACLLPFLSAM